MQISKQQIKHKQQPGGFLHFPFLRHKQLIPFTANVIGFQIFAFSIRGIPWNRYSVHAYV